MSRIPLRVVQERPPLVECTDCGHCCTYLGIETEAPTRPIYATNILWYLYHEKTYVYRDGDDEWSVHFEARCRNLGQDNLCAVYRQRPQICRHFDNRTCEVNGPGESITFRDPQSFLNWLAENKPKVYAKIEDEYVPHSLRVRPRRPGPANAAGRAGRKGKRA